MGPTGTACLIDAGPPGQGTATVVPLLNQLGITSLAYTVLTHHHDDHYGGMAEVVAAGFLPAFAAYDRGTVNQPSGYALFDQYVAAVGMKRTTLSPGAVIDLGGGAALRCVGANGLAENGAIVVVLGTSQEENSRSIALKLTYGSFSEALGGDMTGGAQGTADVESIYAPLIGDVDVYRVAHHGALDGTSPAFLGAITPEVSVISCGVTAFGFPHQGTLDLLLAQPQTAAVYRLLACSSSVGGTVVNGTLLIETNGSTYTCSGGSVPPSTRAVDEAYLPPVVLHHPGDVVVSEYMADPAAVSDSLGEWVELRNMTPVALGLRGFVLRDLGVDYAVLPSSLTIPALGFVVIGRSSSSSQNGGYTPNAVFPASSFSLANTADQIQLISPQGVLLDSVAYDSTSAYPHPVGRSVERIDATAPATGPNLAASLTVFGAGDRGTPGAVNSVDLTPPVIGAHPAGATVCQGAAASFSVTAYGIGALTYQWRRNGVPIGGAVLPAWSIAAVLPGDQGTYDVVVTGPGGSRTSNGAALVVNLPPAIGTQPAAVAACAGSPVMLEVVASGTAVAFQWRRAGAGIPGATSASYEIPSAGPADAGSYDVVVSNVCGSMTSAAAVVSVTVAPEITDHPASVSCCAASPVTFTALASGSPAAWQWRRNGTAIAGATAPSLSIPAAGGGDAGSYDVVVSNGCGSATSSAATLTVLSAPAITIQPAAVTVCQGGPASLSVAASGPGLTYQWRRGGSQIGGATGATLSIPACAAEDGGTYDVVVVNGCGSATSVPVTLDVVGAITVPVPPVAQSVCSGDPVALSVVASGSPPVAYQWRRQGAPIPGATSPGFMIAAAAVSDAGFYDVVVTDACTETASDAVLVQVAAPSIASLDPTVLPAIWSTPEVDLHVTGSCFSPSSVIWVNGVMFPTTVVDATQVSCTLTPDVMQGLTPGGLGVNVANGTWDVSNTLAIVVDLGANAGTIRRHPLAPAAGDGCAWLLEGGLPLAPLTLVADLGSATPVAGFGGAANLVLGVSPLAGSAGPLIPLVDGLGLFGPSDGAAFDASGTFVFGPFGLPAPALGLTATFQAAYVDSSVVPLGFRLTWARYPERF